MTSPPPKSHSKSPTSSLQWVAQDMHSLSKREELRKSEEVLDQSKTETQQGKPQILNLHDHLKKFSWLCRPSFAACPTSHGLPVLPVCSFSRQLSHDSDIFNTSRSLTQSNVHRYHCVQRLLGSLCSLGTSCRDFPATLPGLSISLKPQPVTPSLLGVLWL